MKASEKRKAEMYGLVDLWRKSGRSQKIICEEAGCSYSVFKYWQRKQKEELEDQESKGGFVPIVASVPEILSGIEITYPNGVQVSFPGKPGVEELRELIKLF